MKMELFLEVHGENLENLRATIQSQIALFVIEFCDKLSSFKIHLVRKNCEVTCSSCNDIDINFNDAKFVKLDYENLDPEVKQCSLPASRVKGHYMLHSGLCGVLRQVVKHAYSASEDETVISLLGYKGMCLKSCAEVSVWTKFCEVEMPNAISKALNKIRSSNSMVDLPVELTKLDHHMKQPPVIRNIGKRRRQAVKQLREQGSNHSVNTSSSTTPTSDEENANVVPSLNQNVTETRETMEGLLQHDFAEGLDMTLTDLILFPCFHYLLDALRSSASEFRSHLPHMIGWYERMWNLARISQTARTCAMDRVEVPVTPSESSEQDIFSWPTVPTSESDIRTSNKRKSKLKPADVCHITEFLQNKGIVPELVEPPGDDEEMLIEWSSLPDAAHPVNGELPAKRVERKCQQLENLVCAVMHVARDSDVIVDFCSGGGHLGILLAYFLPDCKIILVENKEESIERARMRVDRLGLTNVTMYQSNLDYFHGDFDVGVCLHACGVATDLVLNRCLENNAAFVICPCCYGAIQDTHTVTYPRSQCFKETLISYEDYVSLGHGSDQNAENQPLTQQGKLCMTYIDTDRALKAQEQGYKVKLCSLKPPNCTPKNNLLIGWLEDTTELTTE